MEVERQLFSMAYPGPWVSLSSRPRELAVECAPTGWLDHHAHPITVEMVSRASKSAGRRDGDAVPGRLVQELDQFCPCARMSTPLLARSTITRPAFSTPRRKSMRSGQCSRRCGLSANTGGCCRNRSGRGHASARHQHERPWPGSWWAVQAGAPRGFGRLPGTMRHAQVALVEFHGVALQLAAHAGKKRRAGDCTTCRRRQWLAGVDPDRHRPGWSC